MYMRSHEFCKFHGPDVIFDPMLNICRWKKPTD